MLLNKSVEKLTLQLAALVFDDWLRFNRGPAQLLDIPKLKAARAIGVILKRGL